MPTPVACQLSDESKLGPTNGSVDACALHPQIQKMLSPFVTPADETAAAAIKAIQQELDIFDDWLDRYQYIIEIGRKLPPFPEAWKTDAHRVPGCQSQVWMETQLCDNRLYLSGASDAAIVSGLVALLLRVYSGRSLEEIAHTNTDFLMRLGLIAALSSNRGNGVASMAEAIRTLAIHASEELGVSAATQQTAN